MRAVAWLCLAVLLVAGCGKAGPDPHSALLGRWVKGNEAWLLFTPDGMVARVDNRARVGSYAILDGKTLLFEEFSGEAGMRNLWTFELTPKGLDVTYPGGEKVSYGRGEVPRQEHPELVGTWAANMGVGKSNLYCFDASGKFLDVRWIRSSSEKDKDRRQRRVCEGGNWKVEGTSLKLDGLRRRHFNRTYEYSLTGESLQLTSGQAADKKVRSYQKVVSR